jgi:hypothetical protein
MGSGIKVDEQIHVTGIRILAASDTAEDADIRCVSIRGCSQDCCSMFGHALTQG